MSQTPSTNGPFDDLKINVRIKISALWTTLMFCYLYADYFELYVPGKLADMMANNIGPLGEVTQAKLIGTAILLAVPTVMIFLSLVLTPVIARGANIIFGLLYTLVAIATLCAPGAWIFYKIFCVLEIFLTLTIMWYAWRWPRENKTAYSK